MPWIVLCFVWNRLSPLARWIHAVVPLLLIFFEVAMFGQRMLTIEKNWGALYGASLVTFLPLIFIQRGAFFRFLTAFFIYLAVIFVAVWGKISYDQAWGPNVLKLRGDIVIQINPQKKRLLQVLERLHGATVLNGKSDQSYNESPSLAGFSGNRCYIAWYFQEYQCGHGGEAEFRDRQSNAFYAGTLPDPLAFLRSNDIAAVVIFPDDVIPDNILAQLQSQIGSDYYYIDCHEGGPNNAGVFMRIPAVPTNLNPPIK